MLSYAWPASSKALRCIWVVSLGIAGCGEESYSDLNSSSYSDSYWSSRESSYGAGTSGDQIFISGALVIAFQIKVDGVTYADSEDFYTREVSRLAVKVAEAEMFAGSATTFQRSAMR